MRSPRRKPEWQKTLAGERINILFSLAAREAASHPERANRYVELASKIAMRYNIKLGRGGFCRKCLHYLRPGVNSRSRTSKMAVVVTCLDCGSVCRYPYSRPGRASRT